MANQTVVYGKIVDGNERLRIQDRFSDSEADLVWCDRPELCSSAPGSSTVYVDLDDAQFNQADFLVSLATAGDKVKIVGKTSTPSQEQTLRVSKLGVSEILTPDQCLQKLDKFLDGLEKAAPADDGPQSGVNIHALIGRSPQTMEIRNTINLLSEVDFPSALILGPTGTGKSLISGMLHTSGVRANHNLVEVNCSAIPDELFESELFGHAKGAFTDAKTEKSGLFEYAEGGTLFLDEVGNLSASAQAKLLKILEDKKLRKVGAIKEKTVNVRVVAATNLNLEEAILAGTFREDLYFRLNLLTIDIPPLKERPEDIRDLVEYYLGFYASNYRKPGVTIDEQAIQLMQEHNWPGNVRELCNIVERSILLTQTGSIKAKDVRTFLKKGRVGLAERRQIVIEVPPQGITLQTIEQHAVKQVLDACNWNKTETARFLGISRPRLRRIIDAAGLERDRRKR